VEVKQEEKKLSDEAVKTLEKIKEVYDKEVINLRVQNQILTQEKEAYKSKLDEVVKKNADLEST
jgi:succinate dehydrogenase flavin-adding protein (antitoxin of CptAB toxin-antitoxin module)